MRARIRRCERDYPLAERIAWRPVHDAGPFQPARVDNISQSGIAICVPGDTQISQGSAICTLSRRNGSSRRARVVRVEQTRNNHVLETVIGCHWISLRDRTPSNGQPRPCLRVATRKRLEAARVEAAQNEAARIKLAKVQAAKNQTGGLESTRLEAARIEGEHMDAALMHDPHFAASHADVAHSVSIRTVQRETHACNE